MPGELVGEADVEVAVGRLGELRQLGRLRGAHRPHVGVEERAVEVDAARLAALAEPADELRVGREVAQDAPAEHALGAEDDPEVLLRAQSRGGLERRGDAGARRPDRDGRLDRDRRARSQAGADRGDHRVEGGPVGLGVRVDVQRRHRHDEIGPLGHGGRRVGRGPQAPAPHGLAQRLLQALLAGERRQPAVDQVDDARIDVAAGDLVPGGRELRRERQPDLPERDDDRAFMRTTLSPRLALSSTASAQRTVSSPSSSVTTGASGSPPRRSQNASSSASSGSRRESAKRVASPSLTPRSACALDHSEVTLPLRNSVRSAVSVSATSMPRSPRMRLCRRFVGVSQSTMQLNGTSEARRPVTRTRSSCSRPMRWAVCAARVRTGAPPSQRTRSRSWVARSLTTPTSRTRSGNGPTRSVAMRIASPTSSRRSRNARSAGLKRSTCPTAAWTPASRTAAMIADASSEVAASGFSTRM